jgi:hypothetical protein
MCGMEVPGAFDTTWGMKAVCLSVPVALAFSALGDASFRSGRLERNFGVDEGP